MIVVNRREEEPLYKFGAPLAGITVLRTEKVLKDNQDVQQPVFTLLPSSREGGLCKMMMHCIVVCGQVQTLGDSTIADSSYSSARPRHSRGMADVMWSIMQ